MRARRPLLDTLQRSERGTRGLVAAVRAEERETDSSRFSVTSITPSHLALVHKGKAFEEPAHRRGEEAGIPQAAVLRAPNLACVKAGVRMIKKKEDWKTAVATIKGQKSRMKRRMETVVVTSNRRKMMLVATCSPRTKSS